MAKATDKEKCVVCKKTVFAMEKVSVEGTVFHEGCFKCAQCKKKLSPGTYTVLEGTYYCKPHYTQLFTSKGNYSEGFGKEKPTAAWAPSIATFEGTNKDGNKSDKKDEKSQAPKPPGPPGPPPPPPVETSPSGGEDLASAHAAALAAIASGGHQLKHVSREERKRKPETSVVKEKPKAEVKVTKDTFTVKTGIPELKLDGMKWIAKFFTDRQEDPVKINTTDFKQSVTITDCKKAIFVVSGKITNISIMNSEGCAIIFDDVIASSEITRCQKIQVQANGKVPQIIIDKTHSCDVFIQSVAGKEVELVTSLTSGINLNFPGVTEDDDPIEYPIPDQYMSVFEKGKLVTRPSSHV